MVRNVWNRVYPVGVVGVLSVALVVSLVFNVLTLRSLSAANTALDSVRGEMVDAPYDPPTKAPRVDESLERPSFGDTVRSGDFLFTLDRVASGREVFDRDGGVGVPDDTQLVFIDVTVRNQAMEERAWDAADAVRLTDNLGRDFEQTFSTERDSYHVENEYVLYDGEQVTVPLIFSIPSDVFPKELRVSGGEGEQVKVFTILN